MRTPRVHHEITRQLQVPTSPGFGWRWWLTAPLRGYNRAGLWVSASPQRMLSLAWMVGIAMVGIAANHAAAEDILKGPDLAGGGPKTLHEQYSFLTYTLTFSPDSDHEVGWTSLTNLRYNVVHVLCMLVLALGLGLLKGALILLEWLLYLNVYQDSAAQIDLVVQDVAAEVFWPLITATVAVGAFVSYARWRGEGRGFAGDLAWIIAAAVLAVGFVSGPSRIMSGIDEVRQQLANGVITGTTKYVTKTLPSVTGYPRPEITGDATSTATRKLVDGMWNGFGARNWCLAQFGDLPTCERWGSHNLANNDKWKNLRAALIVAGTQLDLPEARELLATVADVPYLRGQDERRLVICLIIFVVCAAFGLLLGRLIIAGLVASVGFLLLLIISVLFLLIWVIPGGPRKLGTGVVLLTVGQAGQVVIIVVTISGVTSVSNIFMLLIPQYGILAVAALTIALFLAALKTQVWIDNAMGIGGSASLGYATVAAIRAVGARLGRVGNRLGARGWQFSKFATRNTAGRAFRASKGPNWTKQPAPRSRDPGHTVLQEGGFSMELLADNVKGAWGRAMEGKLGYGPAWKWAPLPTAPSVRAERPGRGRGQGRGRSSSPVATTSASVGTSAPTASASGTAKSGATSPSGTGAGSSSGAGGKSSGSAGAPSGTSTRAKPSVPSAAPTAKSGAGSHNMAPPGTTPHPSGSARQPKKGQGKKKPPPKPTPPPAGGTP